MIIVDSTGTAAPPGTDFTGLVFICGATAPDFVAAAGTLTNQRKPLTVADTTFTRNAELTSQLEATAHGLATGDGPVQVSSSGTLPDGLTAATDYYVIKIDADTFRLASSLANAYAGTAISMDDAGTGTHTLADTADTERGINGHFMYEGTRAESNHDTPETIVIVDGMVGSTDYRRSSMAGAYTTVGMKASIVRNTARDGSP